MNSEQDTLNTYSIAGTNQSTDDPREILRMAKDHAAQSKADAVIRLQGRNLLICDATGTLLDYRDMEEIAKEFSRLLRGLLSSLDMDAIVATNEAQEDKGTCASHDFLDANIVMADAFRNVMGREVQIESELDAKLWNLAWNEAKENKFHPGHLPDHSLKR